MTGLVLLIGFCCGGYLTAGWLCLLEQIYPRAAPRREGIIIITGPRQEKPE